MSPRILTFGTFDKLHPGHEFVLKEAMQRGDLTVVVARDANVQRIKGHPPVQAEETRRRAIEKRFPKAHAVLGDPTDFLAPVRAVHPDLIILGYDQHLPPGVLESDLLCPVERLPAYEPEIYKSSLRRESRAEKPETK